MTATRALVVEITRGDRVESRHEVDVAGVDVEGRLVRAHGHAARDVMPRSAAKPIQALPLLGTGAADAFGLGDVELALAWLGPFQIRPTIIPRASTSASSPCCAISTYPSTGIWIPRTRCRSTT